MPELPVRLIQELHARQAELQTTLTTLRATLDEAQHHYVAYTKELHGIDTMLRGYDLPEDRPAPGADTEAPAGDTAPAVPPVEDAIVSLLTTYRPMGATQMRRLLQETYGLEIPASSLHDLLTRGRAAGRYTKQGQTWSLTTVEAVEARP